MTALSFPPPLAAAPPRGSSPAPARSSSPPPAPSPAPVRSSPAPRGSSSPPGASAARRSAPTGFVDVLAAHRSPGRTHAAPAGTDAAGEPPATDAGPDVASLLALVPLTTVTSAATVTVSTTTGDGDEGATEATTGTATETVVDAPELLATTSPVAAEPPIDAPSDDVRDATATATDHHPAPASSAADEPAHAPGGNADTHGSSTASTGSATSDPAAGDVAATPHGGPTGGAAAADRAAPATTDGAAAPATDPPAEPAVPAGAVGRDRGRPEVATARPQVDGVVTARGEGVAPAATAPLAGGGAPVTGLPTPSAAAQRVLDLVAQLEDAPPPRVVVIETGEIRVRIGLDAGTVRLTVLGPLGASGEEILREATDALEAGGYGTELDRGDADQRGADRGASGRQPDHPTAAMPARPVSRSRAGLQL